MRRHTISPLSEPVPVQVRTVILDIHADGSMSVTIDGTPHPPTEGSWSRASFPQIIDHASDDRAVPVRVEVHEADGTSFTELLPARPPRRPVAPESAPKRRKEKPAPPALVEVTGDGFVPGEDVACCLIVSHTDATGDGTARALLDPAQVTGAGEVMLLGRISGTVVTRSLR
ncbi:MAG: hypothetical protein ACTIBG_04660 [Brevibacterium aurantiacum]|uniref:Uncharacterized protein n=1 Tax=Brevibacterium aurantiacum TaxID=273384 RepID=A0A3T0DKD5_BREAU|nr:hypothetical protein [Brevibacterium aurantiacum]AZT95516.1 hypothetical protein CXR23_17585 [Brevibacterium aurantiacum]